MRRNQMTPKECAFCGTPFELGDNEDEYYLWTEEGMLFEDGELACLECVNGAPGAAHEALHGKGDEDR
jgi:hypothetical protein